MEKKVLVIGGCGRIGGCVAQDILTHTNSKVIVTSRKPQTVVASPLKFLALDLADTEALKKAISSVDLVVHCAGPFHYREGKVLATCIELGVDYLDVSDHRSLYKKVIPWQEKAKASGITAILNTGVFPGISNSMVKQGIEQFEQPQKIKLNYVVAGSGGAGVTVMRTTFLGLTSSFDVWLDGQWQAKKPYSEREIVDFPEPYGKTGVYWFDVAETYTFAESFDVESVITKFGSVPDLYNHLTWITANIFPRALMKSNFGIEFLSQVSYWMTTVTDKFSGVGIAMRAEITGTIAGKETRYCSTMVHEDTAIAAGAGTGTIAQLILEGNLSKPGIYPVERALPTELFLAGMKKRNIEILEH
ncbi:saccharopine dehydrogenase-like oxidoreductase [Xenococcus sp. PCC 7305]|uniref:saccharopine dehydrogenase family protein n=1 Tax=Xenococcus sp. PCC 7305 TaxID=102125 RepID=UPI0002AC23B6|nr:saccharopine dehydrogenase NADP-binding domain-containing protein [Xenococcus sp. PCC 7305]ELS00910.1 saccharopine dehydrogenase-like oxidoreductase [Xenococcus sp. PCC 7305]